MGKRKKSSRKPQGPKKADPLPTTFTCLFCNHERSVTVKLDKKAGVGQLDCKLQIKAKTDSLAYLSAAVDVYGEWVDAADAVAGKDVGSGSLRGGAPRSRTEGRNGSSRPAGIDDEDEDDDDRRYGGEGIVADDDDY